MALESSIQNRYSCVNVKSLQSISQLVLSQDFDSRFCLTENSICLQSCKTKPGIEYLSLKLFHNLSITCFFLLKNGGTLG